MVPTPSVAMKELILPYSTRTPLAQPTSPPAAMVRMTTKGQGTLASVEFHRHDVHEPDIVGDREIVVAGGDHQHLGKRQQRDRRVVAEDGSEGLRAGEGLRQQDREKDDEKNAEEEEAVRRKDVQRHRPDALGPRWWSGAGVGHGGVYRRRHLCVEPFVRAHGMTPSTTGVGTALIPPTASRQRLDAQLFARQLDEDAAAAEGEHPVADLDQLVEIGRDDDGCGAGRRVLRHHVVDLRLGTDIDADGRVFQDEDAIALAGPPRQHDLLLVAAGERRHVAVGIGRPHVELSQDRRGFRRLGAAAAQAEAGMPEIDGIEEEVLLDRHGGGEGFLGPLSLAKPSLSRNPLGRRGDPRHLAADCNAAARPRDDPRDCPADRFMAGAAKPREARPSSPHSRGTRRDRHGLSGAPLTSIAASASARRRGTMRAAGARPTISLTSCSGATLAGR